MDIVERLRVTGSFVGAKEWMEAADEIERLRAELAQARAKCQAAEDTLAMSVPKFKYDELEAELAAISAAIGTVEYLDPPDGGDVPLNEQVRRMKAELAALKAQQEPVAWCVAYDDPVSGRRIHSDPSMCEPIVTAHVFRCPDLVKVPLYTAPPNTEALKDALKVAMDTEEWLLSILSTLPDDIVPPDHPVFAMARKSIAAIDAALGETK